MFKELTDEQRARLRGANLGGRNFSNHLLDYTDFTGANMRNADITGASLKPVTADPAQLIKCTGYDPDEVDFYPAPRCEAGEPPGPQSSSH